MTNKYREREEREGFVLIGVVIGIFFPETGKSPT